MKATLALVALAATAALAGSVLAGSDTLPFPGRNGWDGSTTFRPSPLKDSSGHAAYYGSDGTTIRQYPLPSSTGLTFSVTGPDGRRGTIRPDALPDSSGNPTYRFRGSDSAGSDE